MEGRKKDRKIRRTMDESMNESFMGHRKGTQCALFTIQPR